jgi:hypothetical protein
MESGTSEHAMLSDVLTQSTAILGIYDSRVNPRSLDFQTLRASSVRFNLYDVLFLRCYYRLGKGRIDEIGRRSDDASSDIRERCLRFSQALHRKDVR